MKAPFLAAVALVAVTFAGAAHAGPGPTSKLYLTYVYGSGNIAVVQGNTIASFPEAYGSPNEMPIAVYGDVRTSGYYSLYPTGGQYTLGGTPTGTTYTLPGNIFVSGAYDSTSDGSHNYLVEINSGTVYQTARDFTNPVALFNVNNIGSPLGITYDAANNSLWVFADYYTNTIADYSLSGALLSSFSTGSIGFTALALDPADHTLWFVDFNSGNLEQFSTTGVWLSTGPYVGYAYGAEFDLAPPTTPEPGTLVMFGSGILGLAGVLRRKINL